ncbi:MAG: M6 family metalloprotease domain-containing protein [Actinomycetes bacterium]
MSAIFGERLLFPQDAGPAVQLVVWGDEFYARRETTSGYTVVYDRDLGLYCYAELVQGRFASTRVPIAKPPPPGVRPHLNEWPVVRQDRMTVRSRALLPTAAADVQLTLGPVGGLLPGRRLSRGSVRGLTVLVQFPDQQSSVTTAQVDALLNQPGYALDSNRGSVRDFWLTMSNGKLDYSNDVVGPVTLSRPMSSYFVPENTPAPAAALIGEALDLALAGGVDLRTYDSLGEGVVDALSFMYAGLTLYHMPFWPHNSVYQRTFADGMRTYFYTITSMGRSRVDLSIGTFCHEAGHLLCRFPDLYDYGERDGDFENSSGLGRYCVMSSGNHLGSGRVPSALCAYLRDLAGWPDDVVTLNGPGNVQATYGDYARVLKYETGLPNEYFLVENRSQLGADAQLPDGGLAVYHCDTLGSNELQAGTAARHYQCALLQADGHLDLEQGANVGDTGDLYPALAGVALSDTTNPSSRRWDRSGSGLVISEISAPGPVIQFRIGGPATPSTPSATGVFSAETTSVLLIPDNVPAGVDSRVELTGNGTIGAIRVQADVIHTYIGDLSFALISPAGDRVMLRDQVGGGADDLHETWTSATVPALANLVGQPFAGRWTLHIADHARRDTGRLDRWRLEVDPAAAPAPIEVVADVPAGGLAIPDANAVGIASALTVAEAAVVAGVQVTVDIRHPFIGDLVVALTAPPGAVAILHNRTGAGSDDLRRSYDATNAPTLASFAGLPAQGTWTLRVRDVAAVDVGHLLGWSLRLTV